MVNVILSLGKGAPHDECQGKSLGSWERVEVSFQLKLMSILDCAATPKFLYMSYAENTLLHHKQYPNLSS
jgi:hypothetical protein